MVGRGRWSRRQQPNGYQLVWRGISEGYCWSRRTGGLKGYHKPTGSSGRLVIRARGLEDKRLVSIDLEKSGVRVSR